MTALAIHHGKAHVATGLDVLVELLVGARVKQIRAGRDHVELVTGEVEHRVNGGGSRHRGVRLRVDVIERQCLAVVIEILVDQIALAVGVELVRP